MPVEVERLQGELPTKVEIGNVDGEKQEAVSSDANQEVANGTSHGGNDNGNGNGNCNGEDKEETDGSYVFVTENDTVGDDPVVSDPYLRPSDAIVEKDGDGVAKVENETSEEQKMENGEPVDSSLEVSQVSQVLAESEAEREDDGLVEAVVEITKSEIEGSHESRDGDLENGEGEKLESTEEVEQNQDSEVQPKGLQDESEGQINTDRKIDMEGDQRNEIEGQDKSTMDLDCSEDLQHSEDIERPVESNVGRESELVCNETSLDDPKDDNLSLGPSVQADSGSTFNVSESVRALGSEDDGIGSESTSVMESVSVERDDDSEMESDIVKVSASNKNGDVQMVSEAENAQTSVERDDVEMESDVVKVSASDKNGDVQMVSEAENAQTSVERDDTEMGSDVVKVSASEESSDVQTVPEAENAQTSHDTDASTELETSNINGDVKEESENLTVPSLDEDASRQSESQVIEVHKSVSDEGAELEPKAVDIPASDEGSAVIGLSEENLSGTDITDVLSCTNHQEPDHTEKSELVETPSSPTRLEAPPTENGSNGRGSSELDINQDMKDESIAEVNVGTDADVCQNAIEEAESSPTCDLPGDVARESTESLSKDLSGDSEATVSELAENSTNRAADEMCTTAFEPEVVQSNRTCSDPHVDLPTPEHSKVDIEVENNSKVNGTMDIPKVVCDDSTTEEACEVEVANIKESSVMNAAEEVESETKSLYNTEFPLLSNGKVNADIEGEPKEKGNESSWATACFASKTKASVRDLEPGVALSTDTTHTGNEDASLEAVVDSVDSQLTEHIGGNNAIENGSETSTSFKDEKAGIDAQTELRYTADTADVTDAKVASTCEDSDGPSVKLQGEGETQKDQALASSGEVSAPDASEGQALPTEVERKPFFFLPRVPRYDDEKLAELLKQAEVQVDQKTQIRDAIRAEIQEIKVSCKEYDVDFKAAIAEERSARKAMHSKRQEIESLQSVINRVKSAMSVDDIDSKVRSMEHMIQHETLHLNEEKRLLREMKQLKQLREQISSNMGTQDEVQQALDDKEKTEERLMALRKELDMLRNDLSKAEVVTKAARKRYDEEWEKQSKLQEQFRAADAVRQEAYVHLQSLRKQLREKNKYFFKYRDDLKAAIEMALKKDREALQSFCLDQVETFMNLWNEDDEFRKYYIRCNTRSTLRRLGTLDGRSLGPDEEPTQIPHARSERADKLRTSNVRPEKHETVPPASAQQEKVIRFEDVKAENTKAVANKPTEQKNQTTKSKKPAKSTPPPIALSSISNGEEIEESTTEEEQQPKLSKEEEERLRIAEEKRKLEEAAKLREQLRVEEIAKAKEAMERKKKREEKAKARAALRAQKEAEEKEKEREKKLRKKERKGMSASREDTSTQSPENPLPTSDAQSETPKEMAESPEKQVAATNQPKKSHKATQFLKQTKSKSIPPPLRNRSSKRRLKQYMWVVLVAIVVFALFLLGNSNLSFSPANLLFLI